MSDTDTTPWADGLAPEQSTADEALAQLLAVLDLAPVDGEDDVFLGQSQRMPWGRVYGGQVLGQSVRAAQLTVDDDRPVHSMHGYFLRAGDDSEPITFSVERLRDGHSFSARRVHAIQFGRPILSMIASFQVPAEGLDHHLPMPDDVPDPESLPTMIERYGHLDTDAARRWMRRRPMDLRHVDAPTFILPSQETRPTTRIWMKANAPLADDPALHAAVLAYASDYSLLEPVFRAHSRSFAEPGMKVASLDHAMWWHRPARVDEWLLFVLDSPSAQGARGLGTGQVYSRDGELVATVAQEGMIRLPR